MSKESFSSRLPQPSEPSRGAPAEPGRKGISRHGLFKDSAGLGGSMLAMGALDAQVLAGGDVDKPEDFELELGNRGDIPLSEGRPSRRMP